MFNKVHAVGWGRERGVGDLNYRNNKINHHHHHNYLLSSFIIIIMIIISPNNNRILNLGDNLFPNQNPPSPPPKMLAQPLSLSFSLSFSLSLPAPGQFPTSSFFFRQGGRARRFYPTSNNDWPRFLGGGEGEFFKFKILFSFKILLFLKFPC